MTEEHAPIALAEAQAAMADRHVLATGVVNPKVVAYT